MIGCWTANVFARRVSENDPSAIVIDEVAAQCLVLTAAPLSPAYFIAGFLLFRLTDILKPWPASWADQSVKGGFGIMLDDIFAGVYAWALLYGVAILFG